MACRRRSSGFGIIRLLREYLYTIVGEYDPDGDMTDRRGQGDEKSRLGRAILVLGLSIVSHVDQRNNLSFGKKLLK